MAATCQERGITHVKDVFTGPIKSPKSPEKEIAGSFFFGFSTGTKPKPDDITGSKAGGKGTPGGFVMRNGRNKDVDIMEMPVPPPRRQKENSESSNGPTSPTSPKPNGPSSPKHNGPISPKHNGPTSPRTPTGPKLVSEKDTYLSPRSVQKPAQRNSSARTEDVNRGQNVTVAMVHNPPAKALRTPPAVVPTSPKRAAPLPPPQSPRGPTSPAWPSPPPPLTPPSHQTPSSPMSIPPPPPQFATSPTRAAPPPPPPGVARTFSPPLPPNLPPPPPPPVNFSPPQRTSGDQHRTSGDHQRTSGSHQKTSGDHHRTSGDHHRTSGDHHGTSGDQSSRSRYSSDSHTLHIDTTSPLTHAHRARHGSGDYSTGSLFGGEGDRDIFTPSQDQSPPPVFTNSTPTSPAGLLTDTPSPDRTSFTKRPEGVDYNKKRQSGLGKSLDTESSILTNSEHGAASSGYFSELSTTESDKTASPLPPGEKGRVGAGASETSSSCEEEGFTLNFEEDNNADTSQTKIYHEYAGEDFGQYLQEEDPYPPASTTLTRRVQRHKQQQLPSPQTRTLPPPSHKKPGFKQKMSQAFTLSRADRKQPRYQANPHPQPKTSIHQMSFMSSKMGMYASEEELTSYMSRDLETRSDLGGRQGSVSPTPKQVPAWHKDTLSMSTLRRAKRELDQRPAFSTSTPNLADPGHYPSSPPSSPRYGESYSDYGAEVAKKKKKVNRFKFWKGFGKKKRDAGGDGEVVDVKL